jgi:hypothetical protein
MYKKHLWLLPLALAASVLAQSLTSIVSAQTTTQTPSTTVSCDTSGPEPLTVAMASNGTRTDLILWRDRSFESQGWSPNARCQHVSKKLNTLYASLGRDFLIYHGRVNNQPVLCAVESVWGRYQCRQGGQILTLKHNENPEQVFQELMAAATQASGGRPVVRSTDLPVPFGDWLDAASEAAE